MFIVLSVFIFIFGLIIGSFLNVVILRLNSGFSALKGRSKCFSCNKILRWYELIPLVSFLWQGGRCKECKSKISWQYPLVEVTTALLFLLIFNFQFSIFNEFPISLAGQANFQFPPSGQLFSLIVGTAYFWILTSLLIVIFVYDLRHLIIPNKIVWIFNFLAFLYLWQLPGLDFKFANFLAGICFWGLFAFMWFVSRGKWMGFGDAKLALGLGWILGPSSAFVAGVLSFWIGALVGISLVLIKGKKFGMKSQIPFGPFLVLASFVAFFFGSYIFNLLTL